VERKWWTLLVVCAGIFMLLLDLTIIVVALPDIQTELHAGFGDLQWTVSAYALTLASLLLTTGSLADRYGRRLMFTGGLIIFTAGSLACGLAQSPVMLIISRAAQGVGGAILMSTSLALLAATFHGRERGVAFGVWGAVTGAAVALGPILGGVITSAISWRGIFLVNLPIGIAATVATRARVDESRESDPTHPATPPDYPGFVLLTAGLISLVYGFIRVSGHGWGDTGVLVCLAAGCLLLAGFIVAEARSKHPMFDLGLLRIPTFAGGSIAAFTMNGSLFAMLLYLVLYLQDALGYSASQTGVRLLIITVAMFVAATGSGRLSGHVPVRWMIGPGLVLVGIGLALMSGLDATSSWTHLIPGFVVAGVGSGLVNPPLASTAVGVVDPHRAGMASGVNATFRQVGIAVATAALGTIFTSALQRSLRHGLAAVPALAGRASEITAQVQQGNFRAVLASVPPGQRVRVEAAAHAAFASGLNDLLLVTAAVALIGGLASVALIRSRDFAHTRAAAGVSRPAEASA
jgi:EmrB/QacA subfamily drug resistance transporter